jgi:hypothetical protein
MSAPLNNSQKGFLCLLYRRAFDHQALGEAADPETWRHDQQVKACGKSSLRACTQSDFAALMARGYDLSGESGLALKWLLKAGINPKRVAMSKLEAACAERGLSLAYPAAICRRQYRCDLEDATEKQVWCLVYTIRNRRPPVATALRRRAPRPSGTTTITGAA